MLRSLLFATAALAAFAPALAAQETVKQKPAVTLKAGDPAPALAVEKWVKGGPIQRFEPGKVYVVEFWATWCGPCIASMPHISALQREYKDKGVTIIGTNIWEDKEYSDTTLPKVEKFVAAQGDRMDYTIAYDGAARHMDKSFMAAAGRSGIPSAFIVDQKGRIAWMGHPASMDFALSEIVAGTWDLTSGPQKEKAVNEQLSSIRKQLKSDPAAAQAEFEKLAAAYPAVAKHQDALELELLKANGHWDKAYAILAKQVDDAIARKDASTLNALAWPIVDPELKIEKRNLDLALRAAQAAVDLTGSKDGAILDTLARVYFWKGDLAKAIEIQTKAVAVGPEAMKASLQETLDEYKAKGAQ